MPELSAGPAQVIADQPEGGARRVQVIKGRRRRHEPDEQSHDPSSHLLSPEPWHVRLLQLVNRVPRWLLPTVLGLLVLVVVIGAVSARVR